MCQQLVRDLEALQEVMDLNQGEDVIFSYTGDLYLGTDRYDDRQEAEPESPKSDRSD